MKILQGKIVSVKDKTTAVVEVVRKTPHPLYKKLLTSSKKFAVDIQGEAVAIGQQVRIVETRPISKTKYFRLLSQKGDKK